MATRRRSRIGDLLEVRTDNGLGYVQYTYRDSHMGDLVRVFHGLFSSRPDIEALARQKEAYHVFFMVGPSVRYGLVEFVGNYPVPEASVRPRRMRQPLSMRGEKVLNWVIVDENGRRTVNTLTEEEKDLSQNVIWNAAMLVYRLGERWTPREEVRISEAIDEKAAPIAVQSPSIDEPASDAAALQLLVQERPHWIRHYFYFPKKAQAENLAARLRQEGFETISRRSEDEKSWLALARHQIVPETEAIEQLRERFEAMAAELSGEYDGWEAEVPDGSELH